jgi:hypothetical protein
MLPKIAKYKHTRYGGTGATYVEIGPLTIWFSYSEPVAFQVGGEPRVISVNYWGNGTGAHINLIDRDKDKRVKREEFEERLNKVLEKIEVALLPRF